ncbi:WSC-domain-containing protein, partial [Jaminaea rosea]
VLLALLSLVASSHAFWIITHHSLVSQRLDPILSPNTTSAHTHAFVGSAAILDSQSKESMCTTSNVKADKSNYWAPQLYYYHGKGKTFSAVPISYVNTYYLNRYGPSIKQKAGALKAFPKGLRMIAGNATQLNGPSSDATKAKAVSFVCLSSTGGPQTNTLPKGPCPWGIRTQIVFPSCWDGKNLDSSDHQSHVAYPLGGFPDNGDCPSSHPVKFQTLFYEFVYATKDLAVSSTGKSGFVLANGDAVGHSFHADFVSHWDTDVLQSAIDDCTTNLFNDLKSCKPFVASLKDESKDNGGSYCTTKSSVVGERVMGSGHTSLPGCLYVKNGPKAIRGAGKEAADKCAAEAKEKGQPAIKAASGGCFYDNAGSGGARTFGGDYTASGSMTNEVCANYCGDRSFKYSGVEYGQECMCSNQAPTVTAGATCNMPCLGNSTETCGGSWSLTVFDNAAIAAPVSAAASLSSNYQSIGCFADQVAGYGRTLNSYTFNSPNMTINMCTAKCSEQGYPYSGLEYGQECWCGSYKPKTTSSQCTMACTGSSVDTCGGPNALSVY